MGTARRCNLARLFLTLRTYQWGWKPPVTTHPEVAQILIRVSESVVTFLTHLNLQPKSTDLFTRPHIVQHFSIAIVFAREFIEKSSEDPLILSDDTIEELNRARLLQ